MFRILRSMLAQDWQLLVKQESIQVLFFFYCNPTFFIISLIDHYFFQETHSLSWTFLWDNFSQMSSLSSSSCSALQLFLIMVMPPLYLNVVNFHFFPFQFLVHFARSRSARSFPYVVVPSQIGASSWCFRISSVP